MFPVGQVAPKWNKVYHRLMSTRTVTLTVSIPEYSLISYALMGEAIRWDASAREWPEGSPQRATREENAAEARALRAQLESQWETQLKAL